MLYIIRLAKVSFVNGIAMCVCGGREEGRGGGGGWGARLCGVCVRVVRVLCACVCLSLCGVCACGAAWHAEKPSVRSSSRLRVYIKNASVCTGNTPTCV